MPTLPIRSWYSIAEGFLSPRDCVTAGKEAGGDTLVFVEAGTAAGFPEIIAEARAQDVKLVLGLEFYLDYGGKRRKITALARGQEGLGDLYKLAARLRHTEDPAVGEGALLPGGDQEGRVGTLDMLTPNLALVTGGADSMIEDCRAKGDYLESIQYIKNIAEKTGCRVAVGYDPEMKDPRDRQFFQKLSEGMRGVTVLPWRNTYHRVKDAALYPLSVRCVHGKSVPAHYLRSGGVIARMEEVVSPLLTKGAADKFARALQIDPREIKVEEVERDFLFTDKDGVIYSHQQSADRLRERAMVTLDAMISKTKLKGEAAAQRREFYLKRLDSELQAMVDKGVAGRVLLVAEFTEHCRREKIPFITRGSAANSLTCYLNGITYANPVTFNLESERFINPLRASLPDIDVDIASEHISEARDFMRKSGRGGVSLSILVKAGFLDNLQRILRDVGVPYAAGLRGRLAGELGGRKVPDSYEKLTELVGEIGARDKRTKRDAESELRELILSKFPEEHRTSVTEAFKAAKLLEGRPVRWAEHVGVGMRKGVESRMIPMAMGKDGTLSLGVEHEQAEELGFAKVDLLPRGVLDFVSIVRKNMTKAGRICPSLMSAFSPVKREIPELGMGLVGGLDQLGPTKKGRYPHRGILQAWGGGFTNHDLVNYLALIRYGFFNRDGGKTGDPRPSMVAKYCSRNKADDIWQRLGEHLAERAGRAGGEELQKLALLAQRDGMGEPSDVGGGGREILKKRLRALPREIAGLVDLSNPGERVKLLARLTWDGSSDKRAHLAKCREGFINSRKAPESSNEVKTLICQTFDLPMGHELAGELGQFLLAGQDGFIPKPLQQLGAEGREVWLSVTKDTRGLLLFQEQVTEVLHRLSGVDYATCDLVRDSIAHRGREVPAEAKAKIAEGLKKLGGGEGLLDYFANEGPYLFNKGHATIYAGLINWQNNIKRDAPEVFAQSYIEYLRKRGVKGDESKILLGAVLLDLDKLDIKIEAGDILARSHTSFREEGGRKILQLGLDAFVGISDEAIEKFKQGGAKAVADGRKAKYPEELSAAPLLLSPKDAELIFTLAQQDPVGQMRLMQSQIGYVPRDLVARMAKAPEGVAPADHLNFYDPKRPMSTNVWGFVVGEVTIQAGRAGGGGNRPCKVSYQLSTGRGEPIDVTCVFWPESSGGFDGKFTPEGAVGLRTALEHYSRKGIAISTTVSPDPYSGGWKGANYHDVVAPPPKEQPIQERGTVGKDGEIKKNIERVRGRGADNTESRERLQPRAP